MEHEYLYCYSYQLDDDTKKISIIKTKNRIVKETKKTVVYRSICNDYIRRKSDLDLLNGFRGMQSLNPNAEAQYIELLKSDFAEEIATHQRRIDWCNDRLCALENVVILIDEK